tara:strand:+ start:1309 stop:3246 length:1938 start_codon:yes stop_codon:yes gene_type:complete
VRNIKNKLNSNKAIYIDSLHAYNRAIKDDNISSIYTDDPVLAYLLQKQGVINIDSFISKEDNFILGDISLNIADDIDDDIFTNKKLNNIDYIDGLTLARPLGVLISSLLYRSLIFSRLLKHNKIQEIDIYISEKWNAKNNALLETTRFGNIFSKLCEVKFFGNKLIYKIIECPLIDQEELVDSSINNIFIKALLFPLLVNIREFLKKTGLMNIIPFSKTISIIGQPDGIIREALPRLNLKGYKEKIYPKVPKGVSLEYSKLLNKKGNDTDLLDNEIINTYSIFISNFKNLKQFFTNKELLNIASIVDDTLLYHISRLPIWVKAANNYVSDIIRKDKNNKLILASALSSPLSKIVHNIFSLNNYSIILFEHGVTKGISALSYKRLHVSEIYNTDHFVGYSEGSLSTLDKLVKEKRIKSCITGAPIHTKKVLLPSLQRLIWRKKLNIKNIECSLIHVSPYPYSGNRRLGFGSPTETEVFEIEENFIKIYDNSNKTVFYKTYPANRLPYNASLENIFSNYKNIKFMGDLDYRYIRSAFDIIVTGGPSSTFSWCLSANKPLIFFDSEIIYPLINNKVRELIKKSVFYINLDKNNWKIKFNEIISLPYEDLVEKWNNMYFSRTIFIKKHIFCDNKNPSAKVANFIHDLRS